MKFKQIQCKQCKNTIQSSYEGEFVQCLCKAIFIDQTAEYCRIGGSVNDVIELHLE